MEYKITLPYPPSENTYYRRYFPKGFKHPITTLSPQAREFKKKVSAIIKSLKITKPVTGKVYIHIDLYPRLPKDWKKREKRDPLWAEKIKCLDLDNIRKSVYDSLKNLVFGDDKMIWGDSATKYVPTPKDNHKIIVTIKKF